MCVISINIFVLNSFLFIQLFYHKSSEGVNHVFLVGIECTKSPGFEAGLGNYLNSSCNSRLILSSEVTK